MKTDARDFSRIGNPWVHCIQKAPVRLLLVLFLMLGSVPGIGLAAESGAGAPEYSRDNPEKAKADFLFKEPERYMDFRLGMFYPRADSDLFDMVTRELTLEKSDFQAWNLGIDLGFNLFERVDLVFGFDYASRSKTSEFRNYIDEQGLPITQTTDFLETSLTAGIRYLFVPRGRGVGRYAWMPNRIVPFVEAGGGALYYHFEQFGDFVDAATLEIFRAYLKSSGWAPVVYLGGGTDIHLYKSTYVTLDLRYSWSKQDLSRSFTGFDPIDLSGFRATAGISLYY